MPIPFILGAAALAAAGYGVKKGLDAKEDYELADKNNKKASRIVDDTKKSINEQRKNTTARLETLGRNKYKIYSGSVKIFSEEYKKIKNVDYSGIKGYDELAHFKPESPAFNKLTNASLEISSMLSAAGGSVAAGTALAAGTYGAVMSGGFAAATTGTSIATLSGAAATNATLAWLGGGAIGTGFGMAGGMVVLGGLVAGPALAIGGAFMASKAEEAYYESRSNVKKAEKFAEEGKSICAVLQAMETRAGQIDEVLFGLNQWLKHFNVKLKNIIKNNGCNYRTYPAAAKKCVAMATQTVMTLQLILDTPLLTEEGKLAAVSERALQTSQNYLCELDRA